MSFFYLLRENGFDWNHTKDIFYQLTEPQIMLINAMSAKEAQRQEDEANKASRDNKLGGREIHKKSFNLRD